MFRHSLLLSLLFPVYVILVCTGCNSNREGEVARVQVLMAPSQIYCSAPVIARDSRQEKVLWTCDINITWDKYRLFLQERLKPHYTLVFSSESELRYRYVDAGDTYSVTVQKINAAPLQIQVTFEGRPS